MKNNEIIAHTKHRPFPLPQGPWIMKQGWNEVLLAHWPVNEAELLPLIPPGLELQQWEGSPWISITPFILDPFRVRGLPRLPFVNRFLEMNIRTYVIRNGKPGIYFLSLEASSRMAVAGARIAAKLPYHHAAMSAEIKRENTIRYLSERKRRDAGDAVFHGEYRPTGDIFQAQPGSQVHWLTERYCLYTVNSGGEIWTGDIHHLPWPLQQAELRLEANTMTDFDGIRLDSSPSLVTFAKRLEVLFWPIKKC